ncbi:sodium-dependent phosphate transport protein 3 [Biomphalaria glabrata]|nr:sodium-dependent phosphate transport protein 3 [Biomphalaria glabrata]
MAARNRLLESRRQSLDILSASKLQSSSVANGLSERYSTFSVRGDKAETETNNIGARDSSNTEKTNNQTSTQKNVGPTFLQKVFSWRGAIVLLLHTSVLVNVLPRNNMPIALVCMVNRPKVLEVNSTNATDSLATPDNSTIVEDIQFEFDWDSETQGYLLTGVQFVGFLGPLVANMIKSQIGGKLCLILLSLVIVVLSLVSPLAARTNIYLLLAIRIITGICSGATAPVVGEALAWWSPDSEKLTWIAFSYAGFNVGAIVCSVVSGYLCTVSLDNGWPFIFYFTGTVNLIWLMAWYFLYMDKPEKHPYISETERAYILANRTGMTTSTEKKFKAPYKKMVTSIPMLAYVYSSTCHFWTMTIIFTYLPLYISGVLQVTAEKTGLLFSLIAFFRFLGAFFWTGLGNWMISFTSMSKTKIRKLCVFTGFIVAGSLNLSLCFLDVEYKVAALCILMIMMVLQAVGMTGLTVIPLEMAPMFSGLITSINFSFAGLVVISGPLIVANIAPNNTFEEWRIVWILTSVVYISAGIVFVLFGQAELQPWAQGKQEVVPNIVLPFVNMGRRFSNFHETLPLSPVSVTKKFDFGLNAQLAFMLPALPESPQITDQLHLQLDLSPASNTTRHMFAVTSRQDSYREDTSLGVDNTGYQTDQIVSVAVIALNENKQLASGDTATGNNITISDGVQMLRKSYSDTELTLHHKTSVVAQLLDQTRAMDANETADDKIDSQESNVINNDLNINKVSETICATKIKDSVEDYDEHK